MSIKIGILLPRSDMYPTLALDFLNGFRMGLSDRGDNVITPELVIESIGNATGDYVLKTAEKMILQENVDLTISFCSIFNLKELVSIFSAYKKNLIHLDLGGNVLTPDHVSPYVIHQSLNLWQSAYRSGEYAAKNLGKNAAIAASFYDGGYHLLESFVKGFTSNGGNIIYPYVAPFDYKTETYQNLVDGLQNHKPDFVYSLFTYKEEIKVLNALSEKLEDKNLPILWSPLLDLGQQNCTLSNVFSISSWDLDCEDTEMLKFQNSYSQTYEKSPNSIGLLGYETGLTVQQLYSGAEKTPSEIGQSSKQLNIPSPRGKLSFNSFHESQTPVNLVRKYDFSDGTYTRTVIQRMEKTFDETLYDHFKHLTTSGWQNPYIIT